MKCKKCGEADARVLHKLQGDPYCTECIETVTRHVLQKMEDNLGKDTELVREATCNRCGAVEVTSQEIFELATHKKWLCLDCGRHLVTKECYEKTDQLLKNDEKKPVNYAAKFSECLDEVIAPMVKESEKAKDKITKTRILLLIDRLTTRQKIILWHLKRLRGDTVGELESHEEALKKDQKIIFDLLAED